MGEPSPVARVRAWLASPEAADAVLPTLVFQAALHLFALLSAAAAAGVPLASIDLLGIWNRWDAPHYLSIAADGYRASPNPEYIVFFPLLPALVRLGSIVVEPIVAATLISIVCSVFASIGLYRLARLDGSRVEARTAVLLLLVFPTAFSLAAPYTESVFLAAVVWSFLQARHGRWGAASVLALLASLARLQGAFVLPALAIEYLLQRRRLDRSAAWLLLPLAGPLLYLGINQAVFGDPLRFLVMQRDVWFHSATPPWDVVGGLVGGVMTSTPDAKWLTYYAAPLAGLGLLAVTAAWSVVSRRSRPSYAVYTIATLVSLSAVSWPISIARYAIGVFPTFLMLGGLGRRPVVAAAVGIASAVALLWLTAEFTLGHWAG